MKSIKKQVIDSYDEHYVSSCGEVVDLTLEKVEEKIDDIMVWNGCGEDKLSKIREEIKQKLKEMK